MNRMKKRILITGTSGFIGHNLKEKLSLSYDILSPLRTEMNLLDTKAVEKYLTDNKVDYVIHSAVQRTLGLSEEYAKQVLFNNLMMFCNLERCNQLYDKMIFLGSGAEFGKESYIPLMKEDFLGNTVPGDDYGLSKYIMTKISRGVENIYNLRLFGIYGPYEDYNYRFISNVICKTLLGEDIIIHRNVQFDYLYIDDFCNIIERFLKITPKHKEYNICRGKSVEILYIARLVRELAGGTNNIIVEQEGLGCEYSGNNDRILEEIGDYTFMKLEESILKLISFYRNTEFVLKGEY